MQAELARLGLERAEGLGASYADVRVEALKKEIISMKNGRLVVGGGFELTRGVAVRLLVGGAWGFSASRGWTSHAVETAVMRAVEQAKATALCQPHPVQLAPARRIRDSYVTPVEEDAWEVSWEEKVDLLRRCDEAMKRPGVVARLGRMELVHKDKYYANSEGSQIHQNIHHSGAGIAAIAVEGQDVQIRSYPHCWQNGGQFAARGYELIREMALCESAAQVGAEAVQLLSAPPCPSGIATVVIEPTQLALQIHESCGHPVELDRVQGTEASLAGTSFLLPDMLGQFQYGSSAVSLTADATISGGLGTFGYDDEGVQAQRVPLVEEGRFVGYLTSRETAATLGMKSNGTMRADSWFNLPLIRMTNINLEPGAGDLEALLADTGRGLYLSTIRSWSIDDRRLNFQFGCELAREIKDGKLGKFYKNPGYSGLTPDFWRSCDAVCGAEEWSLWGFPTCGKGHPAQSGQVAHGAAPARFRNVQVGGA